MRCCTVVLNDFTTRELDKRYIRYMIISYNCIQMVVIAYKIWIKNCAKLERNALKRKHLKINNNENVEYQNMKETVQSMSMKLTGFHVFIKIKEWLII